MKPFVVIVVLLSFCSNVIAQDIVGTFIISTTYSKVLVLLVLAIVAVFNYFKWLNENGRTDP